MNYPEGVTDKDIDDLMGEDEQEVHYVHTVEYEVDVLLEK